MESDEPALRGESVEGFVASNPVSDRQRTTERSKPQEFPAMYRYPLRMSAEPCYLPPRVVSEREQGQSQPFWSVAEPQSLYNVQYFQMQNDPEMASRVGDVISTDDRVAGNDITHKHYYTGCSAIVYLTVIIVVAAFLGVLTVPQDPTAAVVLLTLSLVPAVTMLSIVKLNCGHFFSVPLMLEMFWSGVLFSAPLAVILEILVQYQTRSIWRCQATNPSVVCDILFVLVVVLGVGFVEEFAKVLPICRFRIGHNGIPQQGLWWFRSAGVPEVVALAALCCGAGFATLENVGYVFHAGLESGVATSLWRAVLSVPFHIACTTYCACQIAQRQFHSKTETQDLNVFGRAKGYWKTSVIYISCLLVPSLLHGLYDAGLFLAIQLSKLSESHRSYSIKTRLLSSLAPTVSDVMGGACHTDTLRTPTALRYIVNQLNNRSDNGIVPYTTESTELYAYLSFACLCVSISCYVATICLAVKAYRRLHELSLTTVSVCAAVPDVTAPTSALLPFRQVSPTGESSNNLIIDGQVCQLQSNYPSVTLPTDSITMLPPEYSSYIEMREPTNLEQPAATLCYWNPRKSSSNQPLPQPVQYHQPLTTSTVLHPTETPVVRQNPLNKTELQ